MAQDKADRNATAKARMAARRAAGLCPQCGRTAIKGQRLCAHHRELTQRNAVERRTRRQQAGLCRCGKAKPRPGGKLCRDCWEQNAKDAKAYRQTDAGRAAMDAAKKRRYERRRQAYQCPRCAAALPDAKFIYCAGCRARALRVRKEWQRRKAAERAKEDA